MGIKFFTALLSATIVLSFYACNNSSDSGTTSTDDTTKKTSPDVTTSSSIITTPQNVLVVKHRVANYAKWEAAFEGHDSARLAAGIHKFVIGRGVQDSNMVIVAMRVDDTARAMTFAKDPALKTVMKNGGVLGTPEVSFITMLYQDTSTISAPLRSVVAFTVKDWDTWLQNFQAGAQERTDNGLIVRSYSHDANDNHKVRVVTALADSAKAMAYFASDGLKKRMQDGGVQGKADRFIYRVIKRY